MALTITIVPDTLFYVGPSMKAQMVTCAPAVSDYPTGGWVITPTQVGFGNGNIFGAQLLGQKYVSGGSYDFMVNMPSSFYTSQQPTGTSFAVSAYGDASSAGLQPEVSASTDLSGFPFGLIVYGY